MRYTDKICFYVMARTAQNLYRHINVALLFLFTAYLLTKPELANLQACSGFLLPMAHVAPSIAEQGTTSARIQIVSIEAFKLILLMPSFR